MKNAGSLLVIFFILLSHSCNRVKNKGKELAGKMEQKLKERSQNIADKIVPQFDAYSHDTKANKKRFSDFLQVELTPDIKNIYCFEDAIGIDAAYQFSFNCDTSTVKKIIARHQLVLNTANTDDGLGIQTDFKWWDKKKIEKLKLYSWKGEHEYYQYFWYDSNEQKAYYFDFDL